nr:SdpI family protein [Baileyella intestinalis]
MTGFWVFMLFMCLLTPAMMIGFGKYFMKGGPKQINGMFGYRTPRSMKNKETWRFAHQYSGQIWHRSGLALLPVSIVVMLFVCRKSVDVIGIAGLIIVVAQMVVMICVIPFTETALKRNFDDLGRHR